MPSFLCQYRMQHEKQHLATLNDTLHGILASRHSRYGFGAHIWKWLFCSSLQDTLDAGNTTRMLELPVLLFVSL